MPTKQSIQNVDVLSLYIIIASSYRSPTYQEEDYEGLKVISRLECPISGISTRFYHIKALNVFLMASGIFFKISTLTASRLTVFFFFELFLQKNES